MFIQLKEAQFFTLYLKMLLQMRNILEEFSLLPVYFVYLLLDGRETDAGLFLQTYLVSNHKRIDFSNKHQTALMFHVRTVSLCQLLT